MLKAARMLEQLTRRKGMEDVVPDGDSPGEAIICCTTLMIPLLAITWYRFIGWLVIYLAHGMHRTRLRRPR